MNSCPGVTLSFERNRLCPTSQGRGRRTVTPFLESKKEERRKQGSNSEGDLGHPGVDKDTQGHPRAPGVSKGGQGHPGVDKTGPVPPQVQKELEELGGVARSPAIGAESRRFRYRRQPGARSARGGHVSAACCHWRSTPPADPDPRARAGSSLSCPYRQSRIKTACWESFVSGGTLVAILHETLPLLITTQWEL